MSPCSHAEAFQTCSSGTDKTSGLEEGAASGTNPLHQGRVRSFPHVEGQFAAHVFVPVEVSAEMQRSAMRVWKIVEEQMMPRHQLHCTLPPGCEVSTASPASRCSLHLSLSRTFAIQLKTADSVLRSLRRRLRRFKGSLLSPEASPVIALSNDERTRTFFALAFASSPPADSPYSRTGGLDPISKAVSSIDSAMVQHGRKPYYASPRVHISIGWALHDVEQEFTAALREYRRPNSASFRELNVGSEWNVRVQSIICRIGQRDTVVWSK